jgi:hypothetical protein
MVYFCEGNDKEKLDWFKIINIAGEKLTDQELRNAVYTGTWLTNAKSIFSKSNCAAYLLSKGLRQRLAHPPGNSRNGHQLDFQGRDREIYVRSPARPKRERVLDVFQERD